MHSVLARRLEACCPPDVRQRGFIYADGTLENSSVLDAVLGDCRKKLRECHVAVLDFAKAFDTVSHAALIDLLRKRGLPEGFCNYVARLYVTSETVLEVNGARSGPARVGQGVHQGDPLSPVLFNMAMDAILAALPRGVGYRLEGECVSALAYADDLVLLAGSKMRSSIDSVWRTGQMMELFVSHAKSAMLSMVPDEKRKKMHYLSDRTFKVEAARRPDREAVRKWLRLPKDVPIGYFHAATTDGGLAIPSLRTWVLDLIHKRFGRLDSSRWPVANAVARSDRIRRKLQWAEKQL
ncbi:hypothetical protein PYW07_012526 [Mythimna separata]|uniref:Reverse transcriptase domain-containing protein n=1 Tax=Mythimna separata TaxID=271217 RepID=A0AAD8DLG6_MYTSE|nr:hypothetical protein PYW07_012526 [Mythimna separata]